MTSQNKLTIVSQSALSPRPSNSSAGYCRKCLSSAIKCAELYPKLQTMRETGELCDVDITLESTEFKTQAHRLVLAIKSTYFKSYFHKQVQIKEYRFAEEFRADCVEGILGYLYEKNLEISSDNVEGYLKLAVLLELKEVIDRCCQFITKLLSVENFLHYITLSNELHLSWLVDKVFKFLEWNFLDLFLSEDYKNLKSFQLYRLVCSARLRVEREETLYLAVLKWYRHKPASRKKSLEYILQHVHFIRMNPEFLKEIYHELVDELGLCKKKLISAKTVHKISPKHLDVWTSGRRNHIRDVIYVFFSNDIQVDRFDEVQSTCLPCPQLRIPSFDNGETRYALQVDTCLFVLTSLKVLRFNWESYQWDVVGKGTCIRDAGVCEGAGSIIVVGGKDSKAVKSFDIKDRKWSNLTPMQTGRRGPGVICHSQILYVLGGYATEKSEVLSTVESLCLATGKWSYLPSMRIPRCRLCCVIFKDKIFAMGGRDNVTNYVTVETFHLKTGKWEAPKEHMTRAREEFCATVYEEMILCFGGRGVYTIECYDPISNDKWTEIGTMGDGKPTSGLSCVTYRPPFDDAQKQTELMNAWKATNDKTVELLGSIKSS